MPLLLCLQCSIVALEEEQDIPFWYLLWPPVRTSNVNNIISHSEGVLKVLRI
jgi:hypothetical protein